MTIVTIEDYDTTVAKHDRFATRALPKRGKIRTAYNALKFSGKIGATWLRTPQGRQALAFWISKSKYTKYGAIAMAGGIVAFTSSKIPLQNGQTRSIMVKSYTRRKYGKRRNNRHCCPTQC